MAEPIRIEPLSAAHDRSKFSSGSDALDRYFHLQASQDSKRRVATCFVALGAETGEIAGYYTLTATGVSLSEMPPAAVRKLPRYPTVPAVLLGRLAVEKRYRGQGVGRILLADALTRCARAELGVFAMVVDAKDEAAKRFYEHHGFTPLPNWAGRLCLPITDALQRMAR